MAQRRAARHLQKRDRDDLVSRDNSAFVVGQPGKLLTRKQVPAWYAQNNYVHVGYRPVTGSVRSCFRSLGYLHNETINIYTHLIPAVITLVANARLDLHFSSAFPDATLADRLVFHIYLATSSICFGVSSLYHTLLCHSEAYSSFWVRLDYVTIFVQILGSFISGIYIGFYCEPELQRLYWTMIIILALLSGLIVVNKRLQDIKWRGLRLGAFITTGLSAFAPIIHAATIFPYSQLDKQAGLRYYYIEGVIMLLGAVIYASHFPESWKPGRYDILGASHQIFHLCVVLGGIVHLYGIFDAFKWNYEHPRCY